MQRILVMGAASLVGSHLCDRLVGDGREVVAVDDLSTGSFATLAHLRSSPRFCFVEHDVSRKFFAHVDAVFHLALPSSRRACETDPVRAAVTSVLGTVHALEVAEEHAARVVLATSTERFGPGVRCAETLALDCARARGLDVRLVRIAGAYGPRMLPDHPHAVARLTIAALHGRPLEGSPEHRALVCFVDDAVETLMRAMQLDLRIPTVIAPFVETGEDAIASAVAQALGRAEDAPLVAAPIRSSSSPFGGSTAPEALPAELVFGQDPGTELCDGVARTVHWFEQRVGSSGRRRESGIFAARAPIPAAGRRASR